MKETDNKSTKNNFQKFVRNRKVEVVTQSSNPNTQDKVTSSRSARAL